MPAASSSPIHPALGCLADLVTTIESARVCWPRSQRCRTHASGAVCGTGSTRCWRLRCARCWRDAGRSPRSANGLRVRLNRRWPPWGSAGARRAIRPSAGCCKPCTATSWTSPSEPGQRRLRSRPPDLGSLPWTARRNHRYQEFLITTRSAPRSAPAVAPASWPRCAIWPSACCASTARSTSRKLSEITTGIRYGPLHCY